MAESIKPKIGIVTMYYNSSNYGGLLQACALTEYLNQCGYDAKQITYDFYKSNESLNIRCNNKLELFVKHARKKSENFIIKVNNKLHKVNDLRIKRRVSCADFRESIPHTDKVYSTENIFECNSIFDIFITGSDQVWNPDIFRSEFFLSFADLNKVKVAYAASVGNKITANRLVAAYKNALKGFDKISVRERSDVPIIQSFTSLPVEWVIDPVFLLSKKEWDAKCSSITATLRKPYIFCYFLGEDVKQRSIASEFAKSKKCMLVTIPYMQMNYRRCDKKFGDIQLSNVTPNQFLDLIKNSNGIFTDSFHATAFSIIFNKWFVTFGRTDQPYMNDRISNIVSLFECQNRFILSEEDKKITKIEKLSYGQTEYVYKSDKVEQLIQKSKKFLRV